MPLSKELHTLDELKNVTYDALDAKLSNISSQLRQIFGQMQRYNTILDVYLSSDMETPVMVFIADHRNWTQHQLLSLPPYTEAASREWFLATEGKYEIIRNALVLYGILVVYPIPFAYGPFTQLTALLRELLTDHQIFKAIPRKVLVWAVSLGCIPPSEHREWFTSLLETITIRSDIAEWIDFKVVVESILWQSNILDPLMAQTWHSFRRDKSS